jgi:hypothetical protein
VSVVDFKEMELEGEGDQGQATFTGAYEIVCDQPPSVDTIYFVKTYLAGRGIVEGYPLLSFPTATCRKARVRIGKADVKAGRWYWGGSAVFATSTPVDPAAMQVPDPVLRPWKISFRPEVYTEPALRDVGGAEVKNSAGDPVRRDRFKSRTLVSIEMAAVDFDPAWIHLAPQGFLFSRNAAVWKPLGPYSALFHDYSVPQGRGLLRLLTADVGFEVAKLHVPVRAEVLVDDNKDATEGHRDAFWDEGYWGWVDEDDQELGIEQVQLLDPRTGMYPSTPLPLDGHGVLLNRGRPLVELNKQYYPEKDWSVLPIWRP